MHAPMRSNDNYDREKYHSIYLLISRFQVQRVDSISTADLQTFSFGQFDVAQHFFPMFFADQSTHPCRILARISYCYFPEIKSTPFGTQNLLDVKT